MGFRVHVQDVMTGEFLTHDLPLSDIQVKFTLSGPSGLSGKLSPEIPSLESLGAKPWSTWLHVEQDGVIRQSGLLQPMSFSDTDLSVTSEGFSGYPHDTPYLGVYSQINVDPLTVVREIWNHLQNYPQGNLGVVVDSTTVTPARLGTELDQDKKPKPYTLSWWDAKDCGSEIDTLAKSTPFDYIERPEWSETQANVVHYLDFGYPRLGRRRFDVRFVEDENIVSVVPWEEPDNQYASDVLIIGAGEGADAVRGFATEALDSRVRRVVTITDKTITNKDQADALAADEVRRRQVALVAFKEITVDAFHVNAQFGSFNVGDDILVQAHVPWLGDLQLWHRVTSITYAPDTARMSLALARSETFRYGRDDIFSEDIWILDDPVLSILGQTTVLG